MPIALGILAASNQIPAESLNKIEFIGELVLTVKLRAVRGVLPTALAAAQANHQLCVPLDNAEEAALTAQGESFAARHLLDVCAHLHGQQLLSPTPKSVFRGAEEKSDLSEVRGQTMARRALEIAAAGQHSLLMLEPPGTGKTMLASRLPDILPEMTEQEAIESATIQSICQAGFQVANWMPRPFRSPHHTASAVALVGGGSQPKPGETTLAHQGVLFPHELPEFDRKVLEVLREPIESGKITVSSATNQAEFTSQFQLVAAMNPCPCGYLGQARCRCTEEQVSRYRGKISGPLLDRIDMLLEVLAIDKKWLRSRPGDTAPESTAVVRQRVVEARQRQLNRANKK